MVAHKSNRNRRRRLRGGQGDSGMYDDNDQSYVNNMIGNRPDFQPQYPNGLNDQEVQALHEDFESDATGDIPGQNYGTQPVNDYQNGMIVPPQLPQGGNRKSKRSKRKPKRKSARKTKRRLNRTSKKRRSRKKKGGALAWSKLGADMFSKKLTPSGLIETGRTRNYNVGLPKSLTNNPRTADIVTTNSALQFS